MSMHIKNKVIQRGFTLIELLVVIAIIGILASVVLASLNTARAKGADAAIKSTINNARAQAELYYDNHGQSYLTVCTTVSDGIMPMQTGVTNAGGTPSCVDSATAYRFSSILKAPSPTEYYCVDNTGKSEVTQSVPGGTACP